MKHTLLTGILCTFCTLFTSCTSNYYETTVYHYEFPEEIELEEGQAYLDTQHAALNCIYVGKYGRGSSRWQDDFDDWLESDEPFPPDLNDIDGNSYEDSRDAAQENIA